MPALKGARGKSMSLRRRDGESARVYFEASQANSCSLVKVGAKMDLVGCIRFDAFTLLEATFNVEGKLARPSGKIWGSIGWGSSIGRDPGRPWLIPGRRWRG
jgi:hypothetical protein